MLTGSDVNANMTINNAFTAAIQAQCLRDPTVVGCCCCYVMSGSVAQVTVMGEKICLCFGCLQENAGAVFSDFLTLEPVGAKKYHVHPPKTFLHGRNTKKDGGSWSTWGEPMHAQQEHADWLMKVNLFLYHKSN